LRAGCKISSLAGGRERGRPAGRGAVGRDQCFSGEHPVGLFADRTRLELILQSTLSSFAGALYNRGRKGTRMTARLIVAALAFVTLSAVLQADVNHPTGTRGLLLIDKLGGTIRFFDPATLKERASIKAATNPHDFALTADRK